jgi:hypothetical protein
MPLSIGFRLQSEAGLEIDRAYLRAGDRRAGSITDRARNGRAVFLRTQRKRGCQHHRKTQNQASH